MMKVGKVEIACNNIGMNNKMCGALDDKAKKIMTKLQKIQKKQRKRKNKQKKSTENKQKRK